MNRLAGLTLLVLPLILSSCGVPLGVEYREFGPTSITAPEKAKKGTVVPLTLGLIATPAGDGFNVDVQVDEGQRVVTVGITEFEYMHFIGRGYPQMVANLQFTATFTPKSVGTYQVRSKQGETSAQVVVED